MESTESGKFIDWATRHAVEIDSTGGTLPDHQREALRHLIGTARLVGLGESRHDTREQLLFKGRLVRYLVEDLGFRSLILEESFPHAELLERYVTTGQGDLREVVSRQAGWYLWDTEEMLKLFRWIREVNEGRAPGDMVHVFGMDITAPAPGVRAEVDFLRAHDPELPLSDSALGLPLQRGDMWPQTWERYAALPDSSRMELRRNYQVMVDLLSAKREELVAASSERAYARMQLLAQVGRLGNELFLSSGREDGGMIRERGMSDCILWILEREWAGGKAIVWAHNLHVAKSPFRMPEMAEGSLTPMGVRLDEVLGEEYVAIGATFGTGAYSPDLPPGERLFETPPPEVMDGALARAGLSCFVLDLRPAEQDAAASEWLRREREWIAQDAMSRIVPGAAFDAVYFVSSISRAQPTPLALRRFQAAGESP